MEYYDIYDVLCTTLCEILPKVIIEYIIFSYLVVSNKYTYLYTVPYQNNLLRCYMNKQLGLLCCESPIAFTFLDISTGATHDGSIIDCTTCNPNEKMLYFNNDIIIMKNRNVSKLAFNNTRYELVQSVENMSYCYNECVNNNNLYMMCGNNNDLYIYAYDLTNLKQVTRWSYTNNLCKRNIQISVHENILYVYESKTQIYIHDINDNMNLINTKQIKCAYISCIHKNKLYSYTNGVIKVYDILLSRQICEITIEQINQESYYDLIVSDNIIALCGEQHIIFYTF
jgi:hypothetical protein